MNLRISRAIALTLLAALGADRPASAQALSAKGEVPASGPALTADGDVVIYDSAGGAVNLRTSHDSVLQLQSERHAMSFLIDSNDDFDNTSEHKYTWYVNNFQQASRVMEFTIAQGSDDGTLTVAGPVVANGFDLAESFWMSEPVEAGRVVAVDPARGDAVRPSGGPYDRRIVGVASARAGVTLGGTLLSLGHLERHWGAAAVELFERERPELETLVLAASPSLAERREELVARPATGASADELVQLETTIFDRVMRRFFERHLVSVALAGRVPVLADASGGPIAPGDPITAGPEPGVAMRADRPGPIVGYALEGLAAGRGRILVLVQRGWFAGERSSGDLLAEHEAPMDRLRSERDALLAERDQEIAELRRRLEDLTRHFAPEDRLLPASRSAASPSSGHLGEERGVEAGDDP